MNLNRTFRSVRSRAPLLPKYAPALATRLQGRKILGDLFLRLPTQRGLDHNEADTGVLGLRVSDGLASISASLDMPLR